MPTAAVITPSSNSEPRMADIDLVLEQCRVHDVHLDLYTNATLLTPERFAAMAERVYRLHLSFDSQLPDVHERVRVGASYASVVDHLRGFLRLANERRVPVEFVQVMMADNAPALAGYVDFVADLGGRQIRVQALERQNAAYEGLEVRRRYSDAEIGVWPDRAVERAVERRVILTVDADPPLARSVAPVPPQIRGIGPDLLSAFIDTIRSRYPRFCSMASSYLKVTPDGSVYPCCFGQRARALRERDLERAGLPRVPPRHAGRRPRASVRDLSGARAWPRCASRRRGRMSAAASSSSARRLTSLEPSRRVARATMRIPTPFRP